jgi:hypothetical protein
VRTSTGTWQVAPPTRRERTSIAGMTLSSACWKIPIGLDLVLLSMMSSAP